MTYRFPNPVRGVLFDLDGTLIDSIGDIAVAVQSTLRQRGWPEPGRQRLRDWVGSGPRRLIESALEHALRRAPTKAEIDAALKDFYRLYAERLCVETAPYPGVHETLATLRERGIRMAVVTNKSARLTRPLLETLGMDDYFGAIVCADELGARKPDPRPFEAAAERLGLTPADCIVVGDSANDVEAGHAAGCPVVAVPYGYNYGQDVRESGPELVIGAVSELLDHVEPTARAAG